MDCGCWVNDDEDHFVIRIRGSEYLCSGKDVKELIHHCLCVLEGASESLSEDYQNLPAPSLGAQITGNLLGLLGLAKPAMKRRV